MSLLTRVEGEALYGMAHWLPRAFPLTGENVRADRLEESKAVHLICWQARLALTGEKPSGIEDVRDLCVIALAYLRELSAESELRQVIALEAVESAQAKIHQVLNDRGAALGLVLGDAA